MQEIPNHNYEQILDEQRKNEHPISSFLEEVPGIGPLVQVLHDAAQVMGLEHTRRVVADADFETPPYSPEDDYLI